MMNDSVREELRDKISPIVRTPEMTLKAPEPRAPLPFVVPPTPRPVERTPEPVPSADRYDTAEILAKPTSPTLVEFQNKNASLPDWRIELQNAVRKRREAVAVAEAKVAEAVSQTRLQTNGSAAVKAEVVAYSEPAADDPKSKIENALKRIETSRQHFLEGEPTARAAVKAESPASVRAASPAPHTPTKNYPFFIATKNATVLPRPTEIRPPATLAPRTVIEDLPIIEKKDLDTNKLRPLPNSSIISTSLERTPVGDVEPEATSTPIISLARAVDDLVDVDEFENELDSEQLEDAMEEVEDIAPLGLRFNAAVLDLILGSFASLILLSPLMISGGNWYSLAGLVAFIVTCSIVMFIYLTTAVGFFGQTLGMRLFSIEVLDIDEEDYPTLHQAAVNSSVYLASLALGGLGLIPVLLNDEKRAAHDLLSGTIVVREEY